MITAARPAATNSAAGVLISRHWKFQLLAVDFRHALLPWILYVAVLTAYGWKVVAGTITGRAALYGITMALLALSAVTVRVFATDFGHGTAERLLAFPVPRASLWRARLLLSGILTLLPAVMFFAVTIAVEYQQPPDMRQALKAALFALAVVTAVWSSGALYSVLLRRPLLAYSLTVLTPLFLLVIQLVLNIAADAVFLLLIVGLIIAAQVIAAILWLRLEVRS